MARIGLRGDRLKDARERLHLTQGELAVNLGITDDPENKGGKAQISKYEHDRTQPRADMLDRMAEVLNVSVDWLLGRVEDSAGSLTEKSLPPDEVEVLLRYREKNLERYLQLGIQKRDEAPSNKTSKP